MRYVAFLILVAVSFAYCTMASACKPPPVDSAYVVASVTSSKPAKNPPKSGIQLKIGVTNREQLIREYSNLGKVTLPVKQVLNGQFSGSNIRLNVSNVDDCNSWFEPTIGESYITVLPMVYSDGEPVLDRKGTREFGATFYKNELIPLFESKTEPEFGEYSEYQHYSFRDLERLECLNKSDGDYSDWTDKAWRRCVAPGKYVSLDCESSKAGKLVCQESDDTNKRPFDLRRGYSFWGAYGATIATMLPVFASLIGISLFAKGSKRSDD